MSHPFASAQDMGQFDVAVIGGGINGAGIARDLAGRGWRVLLAERDDWAAHTSSASTKLIHGGLRYLEHGAFGLVRKALAEREVLMRSAPHLISPLRFVLPHSAQAGSRPAWMLAAGLWLYDHLAPRQMLPASQRFKLTGTPEGDALQPHLHTAFAYSDGWVDDARLVLHVVMDAEARGATVRSRLRCERAEPDGRGWRLQLRGADGQVQAAQARAIVNATGPWAAQWLAQGVGSAEGVSPRPARRLQLVKGSHIVVASRFAHPSAYLFQNDDARVLFAIPYEGRFTLIGTTDVPYEGDPAQVRISQDEVRYLCTQASRWLAKAVTPANVRWHYAGVRPLLDDGAGRAQALSRDYALELTTAPAPLLTVWGGKLTTFRRLAEQAAGEVGSALGRPGVAWTAQATLPGGDLAAAAGVSAALPQPELMQAFVANMRRQHAWLPEPLAQRWARAYGSQCTRLLAGARALSDLGDALAPGLYSAELQHWRQREWAVTLEDALWRRSKLGLHLDGVERQALQAHWSGDATRADRGLASALA